MDLNGDNKLDFYINWQKKVMNDGDTSFVSFYFQQNDSTFKKGKTLGNLYPVFFKDYGKSYKVKDPILQNILNKYGDKNPQEHLKINNNLIIIKIINAAGEGNTLHYRYLNELNTWKMNKIETWMELPSGTK